MARLNRGFADSNLATGGISGLSAFATAAAPAPAPAPAPVAPVAPADT